MSELKVMNNRVEDDVFFGDSKITEIPEGTVFGGTVFTETVSQDTTPVAVISHESRR
jgi:hypothetical protein